MFKNYIMNQLFLPMDLEELIPPHHVVRVVNDAVNRLDDSFFTKQYTDNERHSYHPKMMTKVIVYTYTQKIYSSRQIAKAARVCRTAKRNICKRICQHKTKVQVL